DERAHLAVRRFARPTVAAPLLEAVMSRLPADAISPSPSFSADGTRMLLDGFGDSFGVDDSYLAVVYDVTSGRRLGAFPFTAAGPIASAALTTSGRAVHWTSRGVGAFYDIATRAADERDGASAERSPDDRWLIVDAPRERLFA